MQFLHLAREFTFSDFVAAEFWEMSQLYML